MGGLPVQYLHLETALILLFLVMIFRAQFLRVRDSNLILREARRHRLILTLWFCVLTAVFSVFLFKVSLLLALELAAGFVLGWLHPVNALCFFIHMLYLRPWEIVTDNMLLLSLPRLIAGFCFISWLVHRPLHGKLTSFNSKALILLLAFSAWLFLSTFQTPNIGEVQLDWFSTFFKALIIFLMCPFFIESERGVWELGWTVVISATTLMAVGYYQFLFERSESGRLISVGMFADPNDLAAIIIMAIPFALVPLLRRRAGLAKVLTGLVFVAFSVMVIWYTKSRGAMLSLVAQAFAYQAFRGARVRWLSVLFTGLTLFLGYSFAVKAVAREAEEMEESSQNRITYWKTAFNMAVHNPLFGVGFEQFPTNFDAYCTGISSEFGLRTAHSSWFLALAESGFIGVILFMAFFLTIAKTAWRNRHRWPAQFYSLVGYGTAMTFLSHTYWIYPYLLSGLIVACDSVQKRLSVDPK